MQGSLIFKVKLFEISLNYTIFIYKMCWFKIKSDSVRMDIDILDNLLPIINILVWKVATNWNNW